MLPPEAMLLVRMMPGYGGRILFLVIRELLCRMRQIGAVAILLAILHRQLHQSTLA
jgi:hypothetical protein